MRVVGMQRPVHHWFRAARSTSPLGTQVPTGRCSGVYTVLICKIDPVASSSSNAATASRLCIRVQIMGSPPFILSVL